MFEVELAHRLATQDGVVSRSQVLALGAREHDLQRLIRRRQLTRVHPGVYVDHTGPPSWQQRAWAAVLVHWPAALTRESALPRPPESAPIQIAVDVRRTVGRLPGIDVHRTPDLVDRVLWRRSPPRVRVEHAAIDVAAAAPDSLAAFHVLANACQTRETRAAAILDVLRSRRVPHGRELRALLSDLDQGACSVLERSTSAWNGVTASPPACGSPGPLSRDGPRCATWSTPASPRSWSWTVGLSTTPLAIVIATSSATSTPPSSGEHSRSA